MSIFSATPRRAISEATKILAEAGVDSAEADARLLMQYAMAEPVGCDSERPELPRVPVSSGELFMRADEPVPSVYERWIARRAEREPLQHIVGAAHFLGLDLFSDPGGFIPRPETELLVDHIARRIRSHVSQVRSTPLGRMLFDGTMTIVDVCTGPGTIALALAHQLKDLADSGVSFTVIGLEKSAEALELARANEQACRKRGAFGESTNFEWIQMDIEEDWRLVQHKLVAVADVVVSNPPYVPCTAAVEQEVHADPPEAVFSGDDGLELMPHIIRAIDLLSAAQCFVAIEHDESHGHQVVELLEKAGVTEVSLHQDFTGCDRFSSATVRRNPAFVPPRVQPTVSSALR